MDALPDPKPTRYAGIEFRSRLEARWAVSLDYNPLIEKWLYEPASYSLPGGWNYTPDFLISVGGSRLFLEIKPCPVSDDYLHCLQASTLVLPAPLLLCVGSFYRSEVPEVFTVVKPASNKRHPLTAHRFYWDDDAVKTAQTFRWDLAGAEDRRPGFRTGSPEEFNRIRRRKPRRK